MDIETVKKTIRVLNRVSQKGFQHFSEQWKFYWNKKKYIFSKETMKKILLI